jgi:tRNA modification GTPase
MTDTIYALSSAAGRAAVAVVRVSGPAVPAIVKAMSGSLPPPRTAVFRSVRHPQTRDVIDEGLVLFFPAPNSATGEHLAEFQIHGGRAVVQALYAALGTFSACRPAEPGEFARRGFENGKIDLTAAEGIADLIDAETEMQRRQAQRQAGGALAALYDDWRERLIQAQALVEAAIDFSDEADVGDGACRAATALASPLLAEIREHLGGASYGEIIRSGYRIVIAGPPNAGKSSLLNALARREAAIVSEEAGTTRDIIEVHLDLEGLPVIVSDTAGIRKTEGRIEQEGIRRALDRIQDANLVLWLQAADADYQEPPPQGALANTSLLAVRTKSDLLSEPHQPAERHSEIFISTLTGHGMTDLIERLVAIAGAETSAQDHLVPTNARHRHYLEAAAVQLQVFLEADMADQELRAEDLRIAASALGRLTGRIDVEDILDEIFFRFCIGK